MPATPRERAREQTLQDITRIGREQLAAVGAAALSLRAVARDLGVVSSAVYRYVKSRDELLTLLLVDGYNELGNAAEAAVADAGEPREQFLALGRAVREWALREPARYGLLFGSPVPGYDAPGEQTTTPGTRVIYALVGIFENAYLSGRLEADPAEPIDDGLAADLGRIRAELGLTIPDHLLARGVLVWSALFGAVNFEVFGQFGADTFIAPAALFEHHLAVLADTAGLPRCRAANGR
ncbi:MULTISPECIES: TetR/AcrR family transcriptional regulator [unclassified Rhodococcus (in: high G+C Gram-positive bacteria)]|uniref:TetR/AcrR family transcriptional regulator n=1 Tax=unclassified Rhodococcus (in: high G+C Gram-positive bacteria) TaxID=192944 RepID=UPI0016399184|nr:MULTISPECIES: TetR/AcrR family transcriptional regulator [unclassified Rhodococcus (in: high G+C Gram-positive bacteria)]MBC2641047.1 TetR/AcrR family transcriptional regulator [Rhodococcus sp. 3A]MBC2894208.1 TetR/AcrR family transcriptional regulator [Rhodococcus sp. 4CII]